MIEVYVILAVVAAAVIAAVSRPGGHGAVREHLLSGELLPPMPGAPGDASVEFRCLDSGQVVLLRHGLTDVYADGAVSLAIKVKGFDIEIEERITPGSPGCQPVADAMFALDFLAPEHYHVKYNSDRTGLFAAFTLHVRPGIVAVRVLSM